MPLPSCSAGHDYSEPSVERLRGANGVTILRKIKVCLGCGKEVEVPESYEVERIKVHPVETE
jgi:hypothetical protein